MLKKIAYGLIILALMMVSAGPMSARAAFAYNVAFSTTIAYQNVGDDTASDINVLLYDSPTDTTPDNWHAPVLPAGGSTQVLVGDIVGGTFNGAAVLTADQPMAATLVQVPPALGTEPRSRNTPVSNGFSNGSETVMIPTILKNYGQFRQITKLGIQNAGGSAVDVTLKIFGTSTTPVTTRTYNLQPNAGQHVDIASISQLANGFSGSATVETVGGSIVASAMELDANGYGSKAFEGVTSGSLTNYMPTALCRYNGQTSYYAIQNVSTTDNANITVRWSNGRTVTRNGVRPFNKVSISGCESSNPSRFLGSATITSNQPIVVMGKIQGGGLTTAHVGFAEGVAKVALPYVRWANNTRYNSGLMSRSYIAIQNVGSTRITGPITVKYVNPNGQVVGTHTITTGVNPGGKVNTTASNAGLSEFGCQNSCTTFGGGVIIEGPAGSQLAVVERVLTTVPSTGERAGEDTNGIPYP